MHSFRSLANCTRYNNKTRTFFEGYLNTDTHYLRKLGKRFFLLWISIEKKIAIKFVHQYQRICEVFGTYSSTLYSQIDNINSANASANETYNDRLT